MSQRPFSRVGLVAVVFISGCPDPPPKGNGGLDLVVVLPDVQGTPLAALNSVDFSGSRIDVAHLADCANPNTEQIITVSSDPFTVDLTTATPNVNRRIAHLAVPVGCVSQIRLIVSDFHIVLAMKTVDGKVPSGPETGVKIVPDEAAPQSGKPFPIVSGMTTTVLVPYDPNQELVVNKGQGAIEKPVLSGKVVPSASVGAAISDQLVVRFKDGTSSKTIAADVAARNATVLRVWHPKNYYTLQLPPGGDLRATIESFHNLPEVAYVLPNSYLAPDMNPNDFTEARQPQWKQASISSPLGAWDTEVGGGDVKTNSLPIVAIVDTGFDLAHEDLYKNFVINKKEIPDSAWMGKLVTDYNGDGSVTVDDLDVDQDGAITFWDLNRPEIDGLGICPKTNNKNFDQNGNEADVCDPLDLVDGEVTDKDGNCGNSTYGWQDNMDADGNKLCDDLVGWDFANSDNRPTAESDGSDAHGTAVAGIVGAIGNNNIDLVGVNWKVGLLPIQTGQPSSVSMSGLVQWRDMVVTAFQYASDQGADIANLSAGFFVTETPLGACPPGGSSTAIVDQGVSMDKFTQYQSALMTEAGDMFPSSLLIVSSAGNCPFDEDDVRILRWPAVVNTHGLRVASVDSTDALSMSSGFGNNLVDIAAPGVNFTVLNMIALLDGQG